MNRNIHEQDNNIIKICEAMHEMTSVTEIYDFLTEILTNAEIDTLSKRWRILSMLKEGETQRNIAKELKVSLCKITRGAVIVKDKNSAVNKILNKGEK